MAQKYKMGACWRWIAITPWTPTFTMSTFETRLAKLDAMMESIRKEQKEAEIAEEKWRKAEKKKAREEKKRRKEEKK